MFYPFTKSLPRQQAAANKSLILVLTPLTLYALDATTAPFCMIQTGRIGSLPP